MTDAKDEYKKMCDVKEIQGDLWDQKYTRREPIIDQTVEWIDWDGGLEIMVWKSMDHGMVIQVITDKDEEIIFAGRSLNVCFLQLWMWQTHNKIWKDGQWVD